MRTIAVLAAALGLAGAAPAYQATINPAAASEPPARANAAGPDRAGWWNDAVFYQVFVRSFADSREGPLAGDGKGDLRGLIERLDYLNDGDPSTDDDLGVNALWLMPIHPSPSYHGYDVLDHKGVHPDYGTLDDFRRLVAECNRRGIRVILDYVMNHTSVEHPWFREARDPASRRFEWYIWSSRRPDYLGPWNQQVWHRISFAGTERYYYGIFSARMPDLNCEHPGVVNALREGASFWLQNGAAGFRLDAARHLVEEGPIQENTAGTRRFLREFRAFLKQENPEAMTIGEVWAPAAVASSYVSDQCDMAFEFDLAAAMIASAKSGSKEEVGRAQRAALELYPPNQYGRFLSNHDQTRVMTQLRGGAGPMRSAAQLLLLGPGVPFIYYGEEMGMTGDKPDEKLRTPMQWSAEAHAGFTTGAPWQALNAGFDRVNVATQSGDENSLLNLYRRLIRARLASPALRFGATRIVDSDRPSVHALLRHTVHEGRTHTALVIFNLGDRLVGEFALSLRAGPLRGDLAATEVLHGEPATPPRLDREGGFVRYKPLRKLDPRTAYVVVLAGTE